MNNMDFKKRLIAMRNSIQDYLDQLDMDEAEKGKPEKGDKKPEKGKSNVEEDKEEED